MPKGTVEIRKGDRRVRIRKRSKFKIGPNRKSTNAAHEMSTEDLVKAYTNGRPRDRSKIAFILRGRGSDVIGEIVDQAADVLATNATA